MLPGGLTIRPATLLAATLGALVLSVLLACAPAYAVVQTNCSQGPQKQLRLAENFATGQDF